MKARLKRPDAPPWRVIEHARNVHEIRFDGVEADIIASGHTHDAWIVPIQRIRLNKENQVNHGEQLHVSTPGYKEEYADGWGGFHIERGGPPKPVGAAWLEFVYHGARGMLYEARLTRSAP